MNKQPNSLHCFVCGVENNAGLQMAFYETPDHPLGVVAEYSVPERFQGYKVVKLAGEILDPAGATLAEAEAMLMEVDPLNFSQLNDDNSTWQVYP